MAIQCPSSASPAGQRWNGMRNWLLHMTYRVLNIGSNSSCDRTDTLFRLNVIDDFTGYAGQNRIIYLLDLACPTINPTIKYHAASFRISSNVKRSLESCASSPSSRAKRLSTFSNTLAKSPPSRSPCAYAPALQPMSNDRPLP